MAPADGGTPRQLTAGKWNVGAGELRGTAPIDWTPDSKSIVFDALRDPGADLKYQASQLSVVDVASMKEVTRIPVGAVPKRNVTVTLQ